MKSEAQCIKMVRVGGRQDWWATELDANSGSSTVRVHILNSGSLLRHPPFRNIRRSGTTRTELSSKANMCLMQPPEFYLKLNKTKISFVTLATFQRLSGQVGLPYWTAEIWNIPLPQGGLWAAML